MALITDRPIEATHVVDGQRHRVGADWRVRFPVDPPTLTTPEGERVLIDASEGWVEVLCTKDGGVEVRGAHALRIEPISANSVAVRLLDAEPRP